VSPIFPWSVNSPHLLPFPISQFRNSSLGIRPMRAFFYRRAPTFSSTTACADFSPLSKLPPSLLRGPTSREANISIGFPQILQGWGSRLLFLLFRADQTFLGKRSPPARTHFLTKSFYLPLTCPVRFWNSTNDCPDRSPPPLFPMAEAPLLYNERSSFFSLDVSLC